MVRPFARGRSARNDAGWGCNATGVDIAVITPAVLPWRTGPALFSIWHAGGLAALGHRVAYGVPWLSARSQRRLWGRVLFADREAHAAWLRAEAARLGAPPLPEIFFFDGVFSRSMFSIFVTEDIFAAGPSARTVLVHEPEHFGWLPVTRARSRVAAQKVVGIVMTNYGYYIRRPGNPLRNAFASGLERRHRVLMRRHADVIVPLSPALDLVGLEDRIVRDQVTGVLDRFADVPPVEEACDGVFFLGRLTWSKGLSEVIDAAAALDLPIDVYGDGLDEGAIRKAAAARGAPVRLKGLTDVPWDVVARYRVFLNPSLSEVLCSTTAEALVAGRHVVMPRCAANRPFEDLPNTHFYDTRMQMLDALRHAMRATPEPPTAARARFDWDTVCRSVAGLLLD